MSLSSRVGGRGPKTTWAQIIAMIEWLENPVNFRLITGGAQKDVGSVVAGAKLKKVDAYKDIADAVNEKCGTHWTKEIGESRFRSMEKLYKRTRDQFHDVSGEKFCLTEEEMRQGVTIEAKLENLCTGYRRLDQLFGDRQNINPSFTLDSEDPTQPDDFCGIGDDEDRKTDRINRVILDLIKQGKTREEIDDLIKLFN